MKIKVAFAAALILAIAAGIGAKSVIDSFKRETIERGHPIWVIKALRNLQVGQILDYDCFSETPIPGEAVHAGDITREEVPQFLGRKLVRYVPEGNPINKRDIFLPASRIKFAISVNRDYRAITIAVDQVTGVAGLIKPKDHVDVLATLVYTAQTPSGVKSMMETMTILENITVLAIDSFTAEHASIPERYRKGSRGGYTSVTLSVTPEEARIITLTQAQSQGMLTLTLRNPAAMKSNVKRLSFDDLWKEIEDAAKLRSEGVTTTPGEK